MNEMIKKRMRAFTSALLAGAVVVSSSLGGGVGFANSSVVFAEEVAEQLSQGIYSVPIVRQFNSFDKSAQTYSSLHFLAQGILTVKDDGTQSLTIGVENWSFTSMSVSLSLPLRSCMNSLRRSLFTHPKRVMGIAFSR